MIVYFDVSCLSRPFDDQTQERIRLETEAIAVVMSKVDSGQWSQVSSEAAIIEVRAIEDIDRRERVLALMPARRLIQALTFAIVQRGQQLAALGFKAADALHLAAAEMCGADVLLSCDDRFCRLSARHRHKVRVRVVNPVDFLMEIGDANP